MRLGFQTFETGKGEEKSEWNTGNWRYFYTKNLKTGEANTRPMFNKQADISDSRTQLIYMIRTQVKKTYLSNNQKNP